MYSFKYMIISLSDLVWKKVFLCIFHMLTRLERPIIIRIKEYINRPLLWKRSMAQSTSKQDKGPNPVFCLATRDRANCLLGISRVGPAKKVPFLLFCLISFFFSLISNCHGVVSWQLATRTGKMGQQQLYLPCSGLPTLPLKKRHCFCNTLNPLLAKLVWSRWLSVTIPFCLKVFLFLFSVTSTLSYCIKMHNKKENKSQQIHVYIFF